MCLHPVQGVPRLLHRVPWDRMDAWNFKQPTVLSFYFNSGREVVQEVTVPWRDQFFVHDQQTFGAQSRLILLTEACQLRGGKSWSSRRLGIVTSSVEKE